MRHCDAPRQTLDELDAAANPNQTPGFHAVVAEFAYAWNPLDTVDNPDDDDQTVYLVAETSEN